VAPQPPFSRVAVLGTGLIGGSFGLAVRAVFPNVHVTGWDRPQILGRAVARGAITDAATDLRSAVVAADLVYIALPVGAIIEHLPEIERAARPGALVSDTGSTKADICRVAAHEFAHEKLFIGGHPLAGREVGGIDNAAADLFRGAKYVLVGDAHEPRTAHFAQFLRDVLGVEPVWLDAETHDWATAIVSHLPQLVAVALAGVVQDETDETGLPVSLAGTGLRDLARLAGSPYDIWRDVCLTNTDNIARALDRLVQALDHLRTRLASRDLEKEFVAANSLYTSLRKME
jgi:prephenate dehydrogenase